MISIFKKELRDCLKWVPAGMLIALVMVWQSLPNDINACTYNIETLLMESMGFAAALIACSFGLLQSLFDIRSDARGYLLHRPVPRSDIFWAKVGAGFVAYAIALIPSALLAIFYLNAKGLDFLPVSGFQVLPAALFTLTIFLIHPAALWIGNRDARWVGTRVLPMAGVILVATFVCGIYSNGFYAVPEIWQYLLIGLLWGINIATLVIVLAAARHAFCNRQMLPPANGKNAYSWASVLGITFSSVVVAGVAVGFLLAAFSPAQDYYSHRTLLMNAAGEFQQVHSERASWNWEDVEYSTRPAGASELDFKPVGDQWKLPEYSILNRVQGRQFSWFNQFSSQGTFESGSATQGHHQLFLHRGQLLSYQRNHLAAVVSPQGVSRNREMPNDRFQNLNVLDYVKSSDINSVRVGANPLVVDSTGLYQLNTETLELKQLIPEGVSEVCLLFSDDQSPATLWTVNGQTLTQHVISAVDELIALHQEGLTKNHEVLLPLIKIDRSTTYQMDLPDPNYSISLFRGDDGRYGYVKSDTKTTEHFYGMLGEDGSVESIGPVDVPVVARDQVTLALAMSPVVFYISGIETLLFGQFGAVPDWGLVVFAFVQSLFAAIGTFLLCGFCGVSSRTRTIWTVLACFVGWGICLAVVACHRRLVKDVCPSCKKPTRVDMETCTHCEKPWLPPELDQIEIFDTLVEAA